MPRPPKLTFAALLVGIFAFLLASSTSARQTEALTIPGQLIAGTPNGAAIPPSLPVTLQMISVREGILQTQETFTDAGGNFTFVNVPRFSEGSEIFYVISATYTNLVQRTPPFSAEDVDEQGTIELHLYETTDELGGLEIAQGTSQVDFTDVQRVGLKILLELQVFNYGDHIPYFTVTDRDANVRSASFHFELPVGAYNIAPEGESGADRFIIQEGPISVIYDTIPIFPNWPAPHIIRLSYFLPYTNGAVIDQIFPVTVNNFAVWVPKNEIQVTSDLFERTEDIQPASSTLTYQVYDQKSPLPANQNLKFTLEGVPDLSPATTSDSSDEEASAWVVLLLAIVGLAIGGGVGYWVWQSRRKAATLIGDSPDKGTSGKL
jgi:hypothetical protein